MFLFIKRAITKIYTKFKSLFYYPNIITSKEYSKPCQTSKMKLFATMMKLELYAYSFQLLIIFAETLVFNEPLTIFAKNLSLIFNRVRNTSL